MIKIIAETGASHRKSYARCLALIDAARKAGADAVKFSLFKPEEMTIDSDEYVITEGPWKGKRLYELYIESNLNYDWIGDLKNASEAAGLEFIVSIYHPNTIDLLKIYGCHTVKIASFELGYTELLEGIAAESHIKHIILSTGGATIEEIQQALIVLEGKKTTLLYCVSAYPALAENMNLLTMADMGRRFGTLVGLSDHTDGITASVTATAMGASIIEKHIKLDNEGLDSSFAIFPDRFSLMVAACKEAEKIVGKIEYSGKKNYHRKQVDGQMIRALW